MLNWGYSVVIRITITGALMLGLLLSPISEPANHEPLWLPGIASAAPAEPMQHADNHIHAHDDGDLDRTEVGHSHDHNPADHSHEKASSPPNLGPVLVLGGQNWQTQLTGLTDPATRVRLDRPPRAVSAA